MFKMRTMLCILKQIGGEKLLSDMLLPEPGDLKKIKFIFSFLSLIEIYLKRNLKEDQRKFFVKCLQCFEGGTLNSVAATIKKYQTNLKGTRMQL